MLSNKEQFKKLGEIIEILDNQRVPVSSVEREKRIAGKNQHDLFPYYGATQQNGRIDDYIFDEELVLLGEDGVLFYDNDKPKAYLVAGKYWVNNHAHVIKGKDGVLLNSYLCYFLNQFDYHGYVSGATRLKLNQSAMKNIQIPLPPLPTQRAIAERLNQIQELIDLKKKTLSKTDELAKAIFLEIFGDLRVNSKGWEEKIFTDVVVLKRGHDLPVQERKEGLYPVIASSNIVGYHHTYKAEGPGIVTGRSGTIGEVQYIEGNYWPLNTTLYSETLRGNNPIYVLYFLRSFELNRYVRGAGVPTLNRNLFNTELVPLPPLPLQQQFADIITEIESQKTEHNQALVKLEELYQSEMQRSFSL